MFSKVEKSLNYDASPLLLWTREVCRHFLLYYRFGGLQLDDGEKTWSTQTVYRILDLFSIFFGKIQIFALPNLIVLGFWMNSVCI
jgi:hypothetical protein